MKRATLRIVLHLCNLILTIELYLASITWIPNEEISIIPYRFFGLAVSTLVYGLLSIAIEYFIEGE